MPGDLHALRGRSDRQQNRKPDHILHEPAQHRITAPPVGLSSSVAQVRPSSAPKARRPVDRGAPPPRCDPAPTPPRRQSQVPDPPISPDARVFPPPPAVTGPQPEQVAAPLQLRWCLRPTPPVSWPDRPARSRCIGSGTAGRHRRPMGRITGGQGGRAEQGQQGGDQAQGGQPIADCQHCHWFDMWQTQFGKAVAARPEQNEQRRGGDSPEPRRKTQRDHCSHQFGRKAFEHGQTLRHLIF